MTARPAYPTLQRALVTLIIALLLVLQVGMARAQTLLVGAGSAWKYLDNGTNQGIAWKAVGFNDSGWPAGPAQLGYGDGDEATIISFGPNASAKYITTYFRRNFEVATPGQYSHLNLRIKRDDGAIVYLNGIEIYRSNMPAGAVTHTTLASSAAADDGANWLSASIASTALVAGTNLLAVEIHQSAGTSSDLSFDLELEGVMAGGTSVTRGPYLQLGTPTSMVVRWRTAAAVASRVQFGLDPASLTQTVQDLTAKTEHVVALTGLAANTQYYYSVGTDTVLLAGGDVNHTFRTHPIAGKPTRIWVLGDAGTKTANQAAVRDAYLAFTGTRETDLWLMLGDNAYENGTDSEYQAAVFDMYKSMLRRSVVWPTIGNHDTAGSGNPAASLPYFQMFTLPANAQAGGLASGTPRYYSFDYGDIHFVCLDSMTSDRSVNGPMLTWLRNDLAANSKRWLIAYWHHPPYTKGSHDSDVEQIEISMRQNALPILEQNGVDLVLSGHSHSYERSFLIDSHYGLSSSFSAANKKNGGDGRLTGSGAYAKASALPAPHEGAVYVVAGSSGKADGGPLNHPAMFISLNNLGSLVLDVNGDQLDAKFVRENGVIADNFTIVKGRGPVIDPTPTAPSALAGTAISRSRIDLQWTDNASNETGYTVQRSTNGTSFSTIATLGANAKTYSSTGLSRNRLYYYRVRAFNAAGTSVFSNVIQVRTLAQ